MTKRREIIKTIRKHAKSTGLSLEFVEGGNHTKVIMGGRRTVIGRHNEINAHTTRDIYKQLGMDP